VVLAEKGVPEREDLATVVGEEPAAEPAKKKKVAAKKGRQTKHKKAAAR
jgi:hypothetical protein